MKTYLIHIQHTFINTHITFIKHINTHNESHIGNFFLSINMHKNTKRFSL